MVRSILNSDGYKLESQIREAYGRVTYSQTCHIKMAKRLVKKGKLYKNIQIILSAVSTTGFVSAIFTTSNPIVSRISAVIGAIVSLALMILNVYLKEFDFTTDANSHKKSSDKLWIIREKYVSLLTDFECLEADQIRNIRDELSMQTAEVYAESMPTDYESYKETKKALKEDEEQTFSDHEIDIMLPEILRRNK